MIFFLWEKRLHSMDSENYMKKSMVVAIEIGMLLGIIVAALTVPRRTPLVTFLVISGGVFVLGNVFLFKRARQASSEENSPNNESESRLYGVVILFALYWLWWFIIHKI
jgi:hypothetical protein